MEVRKGTRAGSARWVVVEPVSGETVSGASRNSIMPLWLHSFEGAKKLKEAPKPFAVNRQNFPVLAVQVNLFNLIRKQDLSKHVNLGDRAARSQLSKQCLLLLFRVRIIHF